jgi:hypothetical protein
LRRSADPGELQRIGWGQYLHSSVWADLDRDQRYAVRARAAAMVRGGDLPLSHQSVAVLWKLPLQVDWPAEVHFLREHARGGRSDPGIRKHAVGFDGRDVELLNGGRTVFTDLFWQAENCVGESDGRVKYFDPVMLAGRTPAEVVHLEKLREDGIRRQVSGFARWDHATGMSMARLRARLMLMGLTPAAPRLTAWRPGRSSAARGRGSRARFGSFAAPSCEAVRR